MHFDAIALGATTEVVSHTRHNASQILTVAVRKWNVAPVPSCIC
jgi:hypothetical protein